MLVPGKFIKLKNGAFAQNVTAPFLKLLMKAFDSSNKKSRKTCLESDDFQLYRIVFGSRYGKCIPPHFGKISGKSPLYRLGTMLFCARLYPSDEDWFPYIKETFNGFGNAIEYLGRYTHKIAVSNSRIPSGTDIQVTFSARGRRPGEPKPKITLGHMEFIRRFLMHVLLSGFQEICYYRFLNNRYKSKNLNLIFSI